MEGFGLLAVEAAAVGGVVLASRLDGFTDSVIDGETGFLIEPMSRVAWTQAILQISSWPFSKRRRFAQDAKSRCCERFSWEMVASRTAAIYEAFEASRGEVDDQ
jgi:glycosyltransferase involved in cell wall biosynthesis